MTTQETLQPAIERLPGFCQRQFSWRGSWQLNRHALGWDLLRAPVNVFYAPIWLLAQLLGWLSLRLGGARPAAVMLNLPTGLSTAVHRELRQRLRLELLGEQALAKLDASQAKTVEFNLDRYLAARAATAEIVANFGVLLSGAFAFGQLTPGGLGFGRRSADAVNLEWATQHFWAGDTLGQLWFGWFPPATPLWLTVLCIGLVLMLIAAAAALSGLIADPLQQVLGLHRRRLDKWLKRLSSALSGGGHYHPSEPYWARLIDGLDWLRF